MANWATLKAAIANVIKTNGNQEITGQVLQDVLNNIISNLGANATFAGIAKPTTNPGAPDGNTFYFATEAGTYPNFGGIVINGGELAALVWNGKEWEKKTITAVIGQNPKLYLGQLDNFFGDNPTEEIVGKIPTAYDLYTQTGGLDIVIGKLFMYSDSMRHVITQVLFTSMTPDDNGALIDVHADGITHMYYRTYGVMAPNLTNGKWTEWKQIVTELDGGTYMQTLEPGDNPITSLNNFNRCENHIYFASTPGTYTKAGNIVVEDAELALIFWSWRTKAFSKKTIYKTSIVQETGDSETTVMSQKAVTEKLNTINDKLNNQISDIEATKDAALNEIEDTEQEAILNFNAQRVTPEMLSEGVKQLIETAGGGTINNLPDEEDITSTGSDMPVLKFKDKAYNQEIFSGKGRVYLRKNIIDGKNILTQSMLNAANSEYIIQYDYDLNGASITVPEGCVLKFEGG